MLSNSVYRVLCLLLCFIMLSSTIHIPILAGLEEPTVGEVVEGAVEGNTITFDYCNEDENLIMITDVLGNVELPIEPIYDGHTFLYWSTEPDGEEYEFFESDIVSLDSNVQYVRFLSATTLYAVWQENEVENERLQTSSANLNLKGLVFDIAVPTSLPIYIDNTGHIIVSTDFVIRNDSGGSVEVTDVFVESENGWTLVDYDTDFSDKAVDLKDVGFILNGDKVGVGGTMALSDNWSNISADGGELLVDYDVNLGIQMSAIKSTSIASIQFTFDWNGEEIEQLTDEELERLNEISIVNEGYTADYVYRVSYEYDLNAVRKYANVLQNNTFCIVMDENIMLESTYNVPNNLILFEGDGRVISGDLSSQSKEGSKTTLNNLIIEGGAIGFNSIDCVSSNWFISCSNISNSSVNSEAGKTVFAYLDCDNIDNCSANSLGNGFVNCSSIIDTTVYTVLGNGFVDCTDIAESHSYVFVGSTSDVRYVGFLNCTNLDSCSGTGTYGFEGCTNMVNCIGTVYEDEVLQQDKTYNVSFIDKTYDAYDSLNANFELSFADGGSGEYSEGDLVTVYVENTGLPWLFNTVKEYNGLDIVFNMDNLTMIGGSFSFYMPAEDIILYLAYEDTSISGMYTVSEYDYPGSLSMDISYLGQYMEGSLVTVEANTQGPNIGSIINVYTSEGEKLAQASFILGEYRVSASFIMPSKDISIYFFDDSLLIEPV